MSAPGRNSWFCFPSNLNVASTSFREASRLAGKQNQSFPKEGDIKWLYYISQHFIANYFGR